MISIDTGLLNRFTLFCHEEILIFFSFLDRRKNVVQSIRVGIVVEQL